MDFWDFAFLQLACWLLHPGYQKEGTKVPSLEEIADMADKLEALRMQRRS